MGEEDTAPAPAPAPPPSTQAWRAYISEDLPRSVQESADSAIGAARSLQQSSSNHLRSLQDVIPQIGARYRNYEEAIFHKVKDELMNLREHPALAGGVAASAILLMRGINPPKIQGFEQADNYKTSMTQTRQQTQRHIHEEKEDGLTNGNNSDLASDSLQTMYSQGLSKKTMDASMATNKFRSRWDTVARIQISDVEADAIQIQTWAATIETIEVTSFGLCNCGSGFVFY